MDLNGTDHSNGESEHVGTLNSEKVVLNGDREVDNESQVLLSAARKGGIARKSDKPPRKVQWNDKNGNKLVEVLEFYPSDVSDSDDEDSDACMCTIM